MSRRPDEAISDPVARLLDGCAATCRLWPEQEEGACDPALLEVIDDGNRGYLAGLCLVLPEPAVAR